MKYVWGYSALWKRKNSGGGLGVRIHPPKQSTFELTVLDGQMNAGADVNFTIYINLDGGLVDLTLLKDEPLSYCRFPNNDYLTTFKYYKFEKILVFDNDTLEFFANPCAANRTMYISFRGLSDVNALPTVESIEVGGTPANCTLEATYGNRMLGVLE